MPSTRLRFGVLWVGAFTALGLLMFAHFYLDVLARGRSEPAGVKLIEELTGSIGAAVCLLPAVWIARRSRTGGWSRLRIVATHAAMLPVFSALHTSWNW